MTGLLTVFQGFIFCHCVNDLAPSGDSACQSRWRHCLRCESAATPSVRSFVQRSPTECGVSECVWL
jgi:hypothetical protein